VEAIKTFHTGVSEDVLLKQEQFQELQKRLLGGAAEFYGRLEKLLQGQADVRSRRALGNAYHELGELTRKIGSQPEALKVQRLALAVRRELAGEPDADVEARLDVARSLLATVRLQKETGDANGALAAAEEARALAEALRGAAPTDQVHAVLAGSHRSIAWVLSQTGKLKEALSAYEQARALEQKLADASPTVTSFRSDLANSHNNIGWTLAQTGQPKEAQVAYEQSLALAQQLAEANPTVTALQRNWANGHINIGALLLDTGRPQAALAAYQKARAIYQKLADANPLAIEYQYGLAGIHNNIGLVLSQSGKTSEALTSYRQTLAIFQKLADANPKVPGFRRAVGMSLNNIGEEQTKADRLPEALATCERARDTHQALVTAYPTVTDYKNGLAFSLSGLGRAQQRAGQDAAAVASLRRAIALRGELPTLSLEARYDLASNQALLATLAKGKASGLTAAEGQAAADVSLEMLRQAVAAGYANLARLRADSDLDVLRSRSEFQKLLKDVAAKAKTPGS
jgi:tetratricopeptide (TPR) repeat protein